MSEYWIQQNGSVDFADGDVGDRNHEGIVISDVQRKIVEACERRFDIERTGFGGSRSFADDEYINWDEFLTALGTAAGKELAAKNPKWNDYVENDPHYFINWALKQSGVKKVDFDCANGQGDARDYAMERWGWKTYRDGNIDTWRLSRSDLQAIISGIENIAEDSGWSDKRLARMSFTITVFSNKKHFSLTLAQMQAWLAKPQVVPPIQNQNPQYDYLTQAANKQNRNAEIEKLHPFYRKNRGGAYGGGGVINQLGDSILHSFKTFLEWYETI